MKERKNKKRERWRLETSYFTEIGTPQDSSPNSISPNWKIFTMQFKFWWKTYRSTSLWHKNLSIQVSPSHNNVIRKQDKKRIIWTQNGQKRLTGFFFEHGVLTKSVENAPIYWNMKYQPKIMKPSREIGEKLPKTLILDTKCWIIWTHIFFFKIGLRHFSTFGTG